MKSVSKVDILVFLGGPVVKNLPANAGDTGSVLDPGRSHMSQSSYARVPQLLSLSCRAWEPEPTGHSY